MAITIEQKDELRVILTEYVGRYGAITKAANSLQHVSASTIRTILKGGDYPNISDALWRSLRSQLTGEKEIGTVIVETTAVKDLLFCMGFTQKGKDFTWAISPSGSGKTISSELMRQHKNVFYVLCDEDMKKSDFALELARAVGLRINTQKKARNVIMEVVQEISELEDVLIIFDEGDKLSDNIMHYFITIYNRLRGKAGILFCSTNYMVKRMEQGLRYNRKGYQEIWSRLGSKFYLVERNTPYDVAAICRANGITDQRHIDVVIKEAEEADLDLRRAERKINALKQKYQIG